MNDLIVSWHAAGRGRAAAACDNHFISSRNTDDIPAFSKALIQTLGGKVETSEMASA